MRTAVVSILFMALILSFAAMGCGKKAPPEPPDEVLRAIGPGR